MPTYHINNRIVYIYENRTMEYAKKHLVGLLHKKIKPHQETIFEEYKRMKFSIGDKDGKPHEFNDINIWSLLEYSLTEEINYLYDILYPEYLSKRISSECWNVFQWLVRKRKSEFQTSNDNS